MSPRRGVCDAKDCPGKTAWPCLDDACRIADAMAAAATPPKRKRWWRR